MILENQILLKINTVNKNNRIYDDAAAATIVEQCKHKFMYGQLGYPDTSDFNSISLNATHISFNIRRVDNDILGDIHLMDNDNGKKLLEIIDNIVFRPRSFGSIADNNVVKIDKLITFDAILKDEDAF